LSGIIREKNAILILKRKYYKQEDLTMAKNFLDDYDEKNKAKSSGTNGRNCSTNKGTSKNSSNASNSQNSSHSGTGKNVGKNANDSYDSAK
jgi:hypothetical protein